MADDDGAFNANWAPAKTNAAATGFSTAAGSMRRGPTKVPNLDGVDDGDTAADLRAELNEELGFYPAKLDDESVAKHRRQAAEPLKETRCVWDDEAKTMRVVFS